METQFYSKIDVQLIDGKNGMHFTSTNSFIDATLAQQNRVKQSRKREREHESIGISLTHTHEHEERESER